MADIFCQTDPPKPEQKRMRQLPVVLMNIFWHKKKRNSEKDTIALLGGT
jgi:hypothetical protein